MRSTSVLCVLALAAATLGSAQIARAQEADEGAAFLQVCNRGSVPAAAAVAEEDDWSLFSYALHVYAWTRIEPGQCQHVYDSPWEIPNPAYVAFGKVDAAGNVTPLAASTVPDIGTWTYSGIYALSRWPGARGPALTAASKPLCVNAGAIDYTLRSKGSVDCTVFRPDGNPGPFSPMYAGLFFHPSGEYCVADDFSSQCVGGEYYLDIAPSAEDSELRAAAGEASQGAAAQTTATSGGAAAALLEAILANPEYRAQFKAGAEAAAASREPDRPRNALEEYDERMRRERPDLFAAPADAGPVSVAGYSQSWVGGEVRTFGTVSRVDRFANHVILELAESPQGLVVCINDFAFLAFDVRSDNDLVGKVVDLHGTVVATPYYCRGGESAIEPLRYGDLEIR